MGASSSDIRAGGAFVELYAKDNALTRGLAAAEGKIRAFGKGISAIGTKFLAAGAAITAPLTAAAKLFADDGKGLLMMSRRTGIAVESLSALVQAFGGDSETLENGIRKMQKALVDAAQGGVGTTAALQRLGLTVHDLAGLSPEDQLMKIADGLVNVHDPAVKAATAMELFGKTGTQLLPGMYAGAQGIRERMAQAVADGRVMTTAEAEQATALAKAWTLLAAETRRVTTAIGSAVAPILKKTADQLRAFTKWILDLVQGHKELFAVAFNVGKALFVVGTAMKIAGFAVGQLANALGLLRAAINIAQNVLAGIGAAISALASPLGIVIAVIVGAGAAWASFTSAGQRAMSAVGEGLVVLKETVSQAAGGIRDALAAGDYALAAEILWQSLKVVFKLGVNSLMNVWREFRDWFVGIAWDISASVLKAFAYLWAEIKKGARSLWEGTQESVAKGIGWLVGVDVSDDIKLRQKKRAADASQIDKDTREFQKSITETNEAEARARDKAREQNTKADQEKLDALRAELKALTDKAAAEKNAGPEPGTPEFYKQPVAQGATELEDLAKRRFAVQGTFNASAAAYMGGFGKLENIQKKQAEALKRIDENIDRIRQLEERNKGMQFA